MRELISDELEAHIYTCNSFYDFFVGCFRHVQYPDFHQYSDINELKNLRGSLGGWYITTDYLKKLDETGIKLLTEILKQTYASNVAEISSMRGHAYMIFKNVTKSSNLKKEEIKIYSNSPTGRNENIPRLLINQITPKTFVILPLKDIKELEFDPNSFDFSFGIPNRVSTNYSGIGEIFFFKESGLEFSRLNIIDIFNSFEEKERKIGHLFAKTNLKTLGIDFFQEDNFIYNVGIYEEAYFGRLREKWSHFKGKIDLKELHWLSLSGDSTVESFK